MNDPNAAGEGDLVSIIDPNTFECLRVPRDSVEPIIRDGKIVAYAEKDQQ